MTSLLLFLARALPSKWRRQLSLWVFNRPGWNNRWMSAQIDKMAKAFREMDAKIIDGAGAGLSFNVGNSRASYLLGTPKSELQDVMSLFLKPGMVVYDIGSNVGFQACIAARLVGPSGSVYCFEPVPSNVAQIEYNARLNGFKNIVTRSMALGRIDCTERFLLSAECTWGALASATDHIAEPIGEMEVEVRQLDSLREKDSLPAPDWVKMDVEGAEIDVLAGAMQTLKQSRPILVIELHRTNHEIAAQLRSLGYYFACLDSPDSVETVDGIPNIIAIPEEKTEQVSMAKRFIEKLYPKQTSSAARSNGMSMEGFSAVGNAAR